MCYFIQKFLSTIKPARNWDPMDPIYRHCWVQWKKQYRVTKERDFTLRREALGIILIPSKGANR